MRLQNMPDANQSEKERTHKLSCWLLELGNGSQSLRVPAAENDQVLLPEFAGHRVASMEGLIEDTYPNILNNLRNSAYFAERAILTPLNNDADDINGLILEKLPGEQRTYFSADSPANADESNLYPVEFLNSLKLSGLPSRCLQLKPGAIVVLMRNLKANLCNGQRLIVVRMQPNVIEVRHATGQSQETFFLPRISLESSDNGTRVLTPS